MLTIQIQKLQVEWITIQIQVPRFLEVKKKLKKKLKKLTTLINFYYLYTIYETLIKRG